METNNTIVMGNKITAYKSVLENINSKCVFLAGNLDEEVQNLNRTPSHIVWTGERMVLYEGGDY